MTFPCRPYAFETKCQLLHSDLSLAVRSHGACLKYLAALLFFQEHAQKRVLGNSRPAKSFGNAGPQWTALKILMGKNPTSRPFTLAYDFSGFGDSYLERVFISCTCKEIVIKSYVCLIGTFLPGNVQNNPKIYILCIYNFYNL